MTLLKFYLITVALGLIAVIVTALEIHAVLPRILKEMGVDKSQIKGTPSEKIASLIKTILMPLLPLYNVLTFILLFSSQRDEAIEMAVKKEIRKAAWNNGYIINEK